MVAATLSGTVRHHYDLAVSRNLGFITRAEQEVLRRSTVAIAGAGGDGGLLAIQLARLGVGSFRLADPEVFETENLNRQAAASFATIGTNKAEAIGRAILGINPEAELHVLPDGVTPDNVEHFIAGTDLLVDETELTTPRVAVMLARVARRGGIPNMTVLNIGFSCMATSFVPGGRTLERVLGLSETEPADSVQAPIDRWLPYLPGYVELDVLRQVSAGEIPIPSVAPGVAVAAGTGTAQAFLHLQHRANPLSARPQPVAAPRALIIDVLTGTVKRLRMNRFNHLRHVALLALNSAFARRAHPETLDLTHT
ncbi:MAG: hypothetical protein HKO87_02675 [Acidimicrobiia bacterium]|nr:hypothetical protein [Acidimicrobiia bacterium]